MEPRKKCSPEKTGWGLECSTEGRKNMRSYPVRAESTWRPKPKMLRWAKTKGAPSGQWKPEVLTRIGPEDASQRLRPLILPGKNGRFGFLREG